MKKKRIIQLIIAGVVVIGAIAGGIAIHHNKQNVPTEDTSFKNLISSEYSVDVHTSKQDDGTKYELNVAGKLDANEIEQLSKKAYSVAKNPSEVVINVFKNSEYDKNFTGFYNKDMKEKVIINKAGVGKAIEYKAIDTVKAEDIKDIPSKYKIKGEEKIDDVDALSISIEDTKNADKLSNVLFSTICKENKDNKKVSNLVVDTQIGQKGIIYDNGNQVEGSYTIFNAK